jgi:hypothetical protein
MTLPVKQQNNGSNNIQWYYIYNNETYGPFYEDELSQDIEEGYITLDSLVKSQDMNDFEQLRYTRLYNVFYENADNTYDNNNEMYYDSDETYYDDEMSNIWLWCIALVPIMSTVMYYFVSTTIVFIITFCLYCFFIWKDENEIRKYGYEIGKWGYLCCMMNIMKNRKKYMIFI